MRRGGELLLFALILSGAAPAWAVGPRVELVLVLEGRASLTAQQRWLPILADAGFVRPQIRASKPGDRLETKQFGPDRAPTYRVTAKLSRNNTITMPDGAKFTSSNRAGLRAWIKDLKKNGPRLRGDRKQAFGLSTTRLHQVRTDLAKPVSFKTKGEKPTKVVEQIGRRLTLPLVLDTAARRALLADDPVRDELSGISSGTALAAVLRTAGLVLRPQSQGGKLSYVVATSRAKGEIWPIGWDSDRAPGKLVPSLFKKETTADIELPLATALEELQGRVGVPFLLDHNNLARHRIDPSRKNVKMKAGKTYYGGVLRRVLSQAGLLYEPRVDEAGRPFLWITTARP